MQKKDQGNYSQQVADAIVVTPGMKMSVVWRQMDAALTKVSGEIHQHNQAMAKTFPIMKKKEFAEFYNATREGKYIKFSDGSQARY